MSEAGPSVDRSSPPSTDSLALVTPKSPSSECDQSPRPSDVRHATTSSSTEDEMISEIPPRSDPVPEPTTAHHLDPPITPLFAARSLSRNQIQIPPLLPPTMPENRPEGSPYQHRTTRQRLLAFFGFGSSPELRDRKDLMSLIWNLGFNGAQVRTLRNWLRAENCGWLITQRSPRSSFCLHILPSTQVHSTPMSANGQLVASPSVYGIRFGP